MGDETPIQTPAEARVRKLEERTNDYMVGIAKAALTLSEAEHCSNGPDNGACLHCVRKANERLNELLPDAPDEISGVGDGGFADE